MVLSDFFPCPSLQSSRTARSEEDRDSLWDAWGSWSECSRTCGGGASYSLRRCLSSKTCEGRNIRYRTCSNVDCPPEAGDFRAQQCSAHNDVKYQGQLYEWLPVSNDPDNPCSLKCQARGMALVVELAPKVLDGTRCYTESLDMCISGLCQIVGCDHQLGSAVKEDNCGVCNGDGSTCRLVRGHYKSQLSASKLVAIPYGSRQVRLVLKGPDHLYLETRTLQGTKSENSLSTTGSFLVENSSIDFQKFPDKEILRMSGPLTADFTVKIHYAGAADSSVQFIFYQPIIHRWRETDFFPCSASCGGGYQLTSAECFDLRSSRVVADQYCHYYPENIKPKPKLQECNLDPCPASDGYKQIMPYDLYHPLPRWESTPWTACSSSCGGGIQSRSISCVEEDIQGHISPVEEWKCMYTPKMPVVQPCNIFDCPKWLAQEWSPCTVTCGQGLRYRVVLCIDHRGMHTGGCSTKTKPHIKEECIVPTPCYKPKEKLPVEAKVPWYKQAQELEEGTAVSEEPSFIPEAWSTCSVTCGVGSQIRLVKCQVLLSFSQSVADLPIDECEGPKPVSQRACYSGPCSGEAAEHTPEETRLLYGSLQEFDELYDWEYEGFTECSESCGGGVQEAVVTCLNKQTREIADETLCVSSRRPPQLLKACSLDPCPPRWEIGNWSTCSLTCGVGLQTRDVFCSHLLSRETNETVILADEFCSKPKPSLVQACNRFDCPPSWYPTEWQECSQTCGGGVQKRDTLCKQRLADGSLLDLPETFCSMPRAVTQQACKNEDCPNEWLLSEWTQVCYVYMRHNRPAHKQSPRIMAVKQVYIQTRKQKKLHFIVGGYAYLLPKTSVILRCPTRRFRKSMITWEKDDRRLVSSAHITIAPYGYMKIHHLKPSDTGTYTCTAGPAREHFIIKLIGSNKKIIAGQPAGIREEEVMRKAGLNNAFREHSLPFTMVTEQKRLDDIIRNLSQQPEELKDIYTEHLVMQLAHEVFKSSLEHQEFVLKASRTSSAETFIPTSVDLANGLHRPHQKPAILRKISAAQQLSASEVVTHLGQTVVLASGTLSVLLHCEAVGNPKPTISWAKNGEEVKYNDSTQQVFLMYCILGCAVDGHPTPNITWLYSGEPLSLQHQLLAAGQILQILNVSDFTDGEFSCLAQNEAGSLTQVTSLALQGNFSVSFFNANMPLPPFPAEYQWSADKLTACSASCGHRGLQLPQLRCLLDGNEVNASYCAETPQPPLQPLACNRRDCPSRWMVTSWSSCTRSCGGGVQTRRVTCQRLTAKGNSVPVPNEACALVSKHPVDTQNCNRQPCVEWAASSWGQVRTKNCWTDVCGVHWRVSLWTVCTATCGNYGFQSRRVDCVHIRTNKPVMEHHCSWRPRPANWQRCNITPCENGTLLRGGEAECRSWKEGRVVSQKHSTGPCSWASWGTSSPDLGKIQCLKPSIPEKNVPIVEAFANSASAGIVSPF
uniref:ADAMTS like 1 n=1 Tax=Catharus ustulatus TaxID=91951 RepID=A0A8C3VHV9_CATUS